jgi:WD40 repeat protein
LYSHLAEDAEFYTAAAMEGDSVVVASRNGFIFLLNTATRDIKIVTDLGGEIMCLSWDKARDLLWIGGENGSLGYTNA